MPTLQAARLVLGLSMFALSSFGDSRSLGNVEGDSPAAAAIATRDEWHPAKGPLMTRWATDVTPENAHREYPRPQMVREEWLNLNGLWEYAITKKDSEWPDSILALNNLRRSGRGFDGQILVPFAVETALSGVMKRVGSDERLWYRRTFTIPDGWKGRRVMLRFGAVDWETNVWLNGKSLGMHRGGYDPFSVDITDSLKPAGEQELVVAVSDPTDASFQPRGKQVRNPHGIWYTPTTGIWQTVWLEPVPTNAIHSIRTHIDRPGGDVLVMVRANRTTDSQQIRITVSDKGKQLVTMTGKGVNFSFPIKDAKLWTPDAPFLYDLKVELIDGDKIIDSVTSYFGLRTISLGKDEHGVTRIMLNGKFLFQYGPLDQGFWPDGLYTAPSDEALRYDIEMTKKLGFNMIRKHVKVEPDRWYYWCDKLGMLVWQDMPSGDKHAAWDPFGRHDNTETTRSPESTENFNREWRAIIDALRNHPSIVMWVPFNEGWGQANTVAVTKWTKEYDPTRLVNCASGGNDFPVGDVIDVHRYPGPVAPKPTEERAAVLGEYGGLGLPVRGHTWQDEKNWGYRSFETSEALTDAYVLLTRQLHPLIGKGLSAAIYTQTTDVEIEVNGLMTYDRAVIKMDAERITAANRRLFEPPPIIKPVVPTSQEHAQTWSYTTEKPADDWFESGFDDLKWKHGSGGFGTEGTPGTRVRTRWATPDIWIRRTVKLESVPGTPVLLIHHDEDAEIYINGKLATKVKGYTTDYVALPLTIDAAKALRAGDNMIAVHCHQTGGGQYIDVGIAEEIDSR